MATTTLYRAASTATLDTKYTLSMWIKRSKLGSEQTLIGVESGTTIELIKFNADNKLYWYNRDAAGNAAESSTAQVFRDAGAFYNLVFAYDSTQASAADQKKIYINGVATAWGSEAAIQSNAVPGMNLSGATRYIGREGAGTSYYYEGLMSYVSFVDGTTYDQSYFGETDSSSGIWKIKTSPSVTYGNNGFFLKMDTSSPGTDSSGKDNTFTASGTPTLTQDNASNNFNTLNPVAYSTSGVTLSNSNTSFNSGSSVQYAFAIPTYALSKGRWYFEAKIGHTCAGLYIGDTNQIIEAVRNSTRIGVGSQQYSWECNGYMQNNNSQTAYGSTATAGDVIGMFVDLEDNKLYIAVNGAIQNSGTGFSCTAAASTDSGFYYVGGIADQCGATANVTADMNYGNGFFGTTAVTSSNADAAGYGLFEYSPNQGGAATFDGSAKNFFGLNTKNLNTYG